jgi:hypothetical protein
MNRSLDDHVGSLQEQSARQSFCQVPEADNRAPNLREHAT